MMYKAAALAALVAAARADATDYTGNAECAQ